jgi:hypothetical protein
MPSPIDKELYKRVKKMADKKFPSKTGIYKSSWIVKEYKKRGGEYKGQKPSKSGLKRWYKEEWVDLNRPIKDRSGKIIGYEQCGRDKLPSTIKYPLCRPMKRISKKTPKTVGELSRRSIKKAQKQKSKVRGKEYIQFGGEKIMVKVPVNVKKWAEYGLRLQKMGFVGDQKTNWIIANRLSKEEYIAIRDLHKIRKWFAKNTKIVYPHIEEWGKLNRPKTKLWKGNNHIINWITWGGNAGFKWVNSKKMLALLNEHFDKKYKKLTK